MKTSNLILLLVGGAIVYYIVTTRAKKPQAIDPDDVTKWDDAKIDRYLVEACATKKKGIVLGTHEKPKLLSLVKQEAHKRGLSIPKCAMSSIDTIDQSFRCPKCAQEPCVCKPLSIEDMANNPLTLATGAMPKCGEGTKFINGRCLPIPKQLQKKKRVMKQMPPSDSYAFPQYINPEGQGYTLQN
jgi:hypothetical protein